MVVGATVVAGGALVVVGATVVVGAAVVVGATVVVGAGTGDIVHVTFGCPVPRHILMSSGNGHSNGVWSK